MYEFCFLIETFDGVKSVVTLVDSTGEKSVDVNTGLLNLITVLNDLGSKGWECVGYSAGFRNTLNFWTMKRIVVAEEPAVE